VDSSTLAPVARTDLDRLLDTVFAGAPVVARRGRVRQALGTMLHVSGIEVAIGDLCELLIPGGAPLLSEVVGLTQDRAVLTPFGPMTGISSGTEVRPCGSRHTLPVGDALLGRVLDGFGRPVDGRGDLPAGLPRVEADNDPPSPLARLPIERPFETGIRVLDALTTVGEGQRIGLFAPAGVGKSTLLGALARGADSEINVIGLIGERGREVREFIDHVLGAEGLRRSVLIVATSDRPAMERARAALVATAVAEHFRARGRRVLLMVDSLTRFARAQRELGLAAGEPPTRRGYPPSLFAALPRLLERAGNDAHGSMTAIYTVLLEGEDVDDPVGEEVRSILDGHIVLSRQLAERNVYPAVDPLASLSRVMTLVARPEHSAAAGRLRALIAKQREVEPLVQMGEYRAGSDPRADEALAKRDAIDAFLKQTGAERDRLADTVARLHKLTGP
jgi:type III secretion protein N (ATPase)